MPERYLCLSINFYYSYVIENVDLILRQGYLRVVKIMTKGTYNLYGSWARFLYRNALVVRGEYFVPFVQTNCPSSTNSGMCVLYHITFRWYIFVQKPCLTTYAVYLYRILNELYFIKFYVHIRIKDFVSLKNNTYVFVRMTSLQWCSI